MSTAWATRAYYLRLDAHNLLDASKRDWATMRAGEFTLWDWLSFVFAYFFIVPLYAACGLGFLVVIVGLAYYAIADPAGFVEALRALAE